MLDSRQEKKTERERKRKRKAIRLVGRPRLDGRITVR